jgi:DNA polymerase III delta prime subunit
MSINNLLLWEKWRPKTLEDIILLPRIRNQFEIDGLIKSKITHETNPDDPCNILTKKNGEIFSDKESQEFNNQRLKYSIKRLFKGTNTNYIFHGHYGTGKTTLARILIGKYSKNTPYLELNSSLFTSIDTLRSEIETFCKTSPMMDTDSDIKYVFLDEFEKVSGSYQDGFKAFVEKYHKNVRFILTTNHLNKISPGIRSRFTEINFDFQDKEEEKYLKTEIYKRINTIILPEEKFQIPKEQLISIITKKFPDFRGMLQSVQIYINTGGIVQESSNVSNKVKTDLFNILYDKSSDYEKVYHFLMGSFGPEKIDVMMNLLGRPFTDWLINEKKEDINKLFELNYIIADYTSKLETNTDPIILGMTIIGKFRDILT